MKEFIDAASQIGELKRVRRSGWKRHGILNGESVGDHCSRCDSLAMILPEEIGVNRSKVRDLMTVHDWGESDPDVGDITPFDGISREEKSGMELRAMETLCAKLKNGPEIMALWLEYETYGTIEAVIAHQLDNIEMALQALEYEQREGIDLTEFFIDARRKIHHPVLLEMFEEIESRRVPINNHNWVI